jgi:hypothetical protein
VNDAGRGEWIPAAPGYGKETSLVNNNQRNNKPKSRTKKKKKPNPPKKKTNPTEKEANLTNTRTATRKRIPAKK